jgi:hypothetical protein
LTKTWKEPFIQVSPFAFNTGIFKLMTCLYRWIGIYIRSIQQSPNVRLSWASVNIRRWIIVIKWELKFYKRPFVFLNLETFILLAVILLLFVPFAVQSCTVPKVN